MGVNTMLPRRIVLKIPLVSLRPAEQFTTPLFEDAVAAKLNARVVEFIAKPSRCDDDILERRRAYRARSVGGDSPGTRIIVTPN